MTKLVTLRITYDPARVGDPATEWDWFQLLNTAPDTRVSVAVEHAEQVTDTTTKATEAE